MLERETRYCVASSARLSPRARSLTTASRSTARGSRPILCPSSLARRMPARTRSMIRIAFQLGDTADDHRDRAAKRARGINIFSEADELHIQVGEFVENLQEVTGGAGEAIKGPDHDDIDLAAADVSQHLIEAGAPRFHSAESVRVLLNDLKATLRGQAAQIMKLRLGVLIDGGDTHI